VGDENRDVESLKQNDDGKIIDHLYKEKSLVFASGADSDLIWHIGDSKYYKDDNDLDPKSIAKQYTYAKNIVQDFFSFEYVEKENLGDKRNETIHGEDVHKGVRYRDPLTEGYSITPNFFLRGELPPYKKDFQFQEPYFRAEIDPKDPKLINIDSQDLWDKRNRHFKNRLFDRDTLLLQVYNLNFLYVLKAYTSKRSSLREEFKRDARKKFRENFLDLLNEKYYFWAIYMPNYESPDYEDKLREFVDNNFRKLTGRIYRPFDIKKCIILALEKESVKESEEEYLIIQNAVKKAGCEVFSLVPQDFFGWDEATLRKTRAWE
jgi:hypothetical protein